MKKLFIAIGFLALLGVGLTARQPAFATPANISQNFKVPVQAELDTDWNCSNSPGPTVNVGGTLVFGDGVTVQFRFQNNAKGTHTYLSPPVDVQFGVTPVGGSISVPKQPSVKQDSGDWWGQGVGGNPYISFQFADENNSPLGDPILLGRCVQGSSYKHISQTLSIPANAHLSVQSLSCVSDKSNLQFGGAGSHIGFAGLLFFDNNIKKVVHRATTSADAGVTLSHGETVPKGGNAGGAGGNPWISVGISQGSNTLFDQTLGRCHQLN